MTVATRTGPLPAAWLPAEALAEITDQLDDLRAWSDLLIGRGDYRGAAVVDFYRHQLARTGWTSRQALEIARALRDANT